MLAWIQLALASGMLTAPPAPSAPAPDSVTRVTSLVVLRAPWPTFRPDLSFFGDSTQGRQRPKPIEYSEAYGVRLEIHKWASYATVPLFVSEYFIGQSLYNNPNTLDHTMLTAHQFVAGAIGGLFVVNTVTGVWNLWESRRDPAGRTRRWIHAGLMIAADAGFVATAVMTPRRFGRTTSVADDATQHRNLALASMGVALASYGIMFLWNNR